MPVIQMVVEAPSTSPLSDIEAGNIAEFLVQLTRPSKPNVSALVEEANLVDSRKLHRI